jgi:hypothetical protein
LSAGEEIGWMLHSTASGVAVLGLALQGRGPADSTSCGGVPRRRAPSPRRQRPGRGVCPRDAGQQSLAFAALRGFRGQSRWQADELVPVAFEQPLRGKVGVVEERIGLGAVCECDERGGIEARGERGVRFAGQPFEQRLAGEIEVAREQADYVLD